MSRQDDVPAPPDMMRGAWVVEVLIVALVLVLVAYSLGAQISIYTYLISLCAAGAIVLGGHTLLKIKKVKPTGSR